MKRGFLFASLAMVSALSFGQTKLDLQLSSLAENGMMSTAKGLNGRPSASMVTVIGVLADGADVPVKALEDMGIKVTFNAYGTAIMSVPTDRILELESLKEFTSLEANKAVHYMNYNSKVAEHVIELHDAQKAQTEGLPQAYNGEGVILGTADTGFDFNHANFRDPVTHKSRFNKVLLFKGRAEDDVVYVDYTTDEIDQLTTDCTSTRHGSHTLGIAAGSYDGDYLDANGQVVYTNLKGAAYKADLIAAALSENNMNEALTMVISTEIAKCADSAGKPLVLSYSFGEIGNWMDGKLAINKFFDEFTDHGNKPGRIVCMSSGNAGSDSCSIYKELNVTNKYSLSAAVGYSENPVDVHIFNSNDADLDISYKIYNMASESEEPLKAYTMDELLKLGLLTYQKNSDHDNRTNAKVAMTFGGINTEGMSEEELPGLFILLTVTSKDKVACKPRLFALSGKEPVSFLNFGSPFISDGDPASAFNYFANTNSVLSVGAWAVNDAWSSYFPMGEDMPPISSLWGENMLNDIGIFSSYVAADDNGVARPDFCAPGFGVISGVNSYNSDYFNENGEPKEEFIFKGKPASNFMIAGRAREEYGRKDGHSSYIIVDSGTSMSCPNAAGIIALWLQANPMLTVNQIREIVSATADNDEFTAASPARFGAGKINALAGLKYILKNYPTAIQEIENGELMGLEVPMVQKVMKNGQIVIVKNGAEYNVFGQQM